MTQELNGHSSRVGASPIPCRSLRSLTFSLRLVVRSLSTGKILSVFGEVRATLAVLAHDTDARLRSQGVDLQAEKRGNFVVISCVDGNRVVSWSLNVRVHSPTRYPNAHLDPARRPSTTPTPCA